jgi:RimJ/RimL family protein N-acetyltransferase
VESARLRYRDLTEDDVRLFGRWFGDPRTMLHTGVSKVLDEAGVRTFVAWQVSRAAAGRPHFRVIERSEDCVPVGHCGLKRVDDWPFAQSSLENDAELEIGYMLDPDWWSHGYATEAARSALDDGFANFGRERMLARANSENAASIAVMIRCGMTFDAEELQDGKRLVQYQLTRRQWESASAAP